LLKTDLPPEKSSSKGDVKLTIPLATLPGIAQIEKPQAPALIIIGGVVSLREKLAWFEPKKN